MFSFFSSLLAQHSFFTLEKSWHGWWWIAEHERQQAAALRPDKPTNKLWLVFFLSSIVWWMVNWSIKTVSWTFCLTIQIKFSLCLPISLSFHPWKGEPWWQWEISGDGGKIWDFVRFSSAASTLPPNMTLLRAARQPSGCVFGASHASHCRCCWASTHFFFQCNYLSAPTCSIRARASEREMCARDMCSVQQVKPLLIFVSIHTPRDKCLEPVEASAARDRQ